MRLAEGWGTVPDGLTMPSTLASNGKDLFPRNHPWIWLCAPTELFPPADLSVRIPSRGMRVSKPDFDLTL